MKFDDDFTEEDLGGMALALFNTDMSEADIGNALRVAARTFGVIDQNNNIIVIKNDVEGERNFNHEI